MEHLKQTAETSIENSSFERKMSNLEVAIDCLEWVSTDFQLDPKHEQYCGFVNINPQDFTNPMWQEFFSTLWMTKGYFQVVLDHFELTIDRAIEQEIIFSKR